MSRDARETLAAEDIAARELEGLVKAGAYVDPLRRVVIAPAAAVRRAPDIESEQMDQVLFGERFDVLRDQDGFAWGQARRDGYVGFVESAALTPQIARPTHRVSAIRTYAFVEPSIKSRALGPYSINSLVVEEAREGRFVKARNSGWFVAAHLSPVGDFESDPVTAAERFLGAPYLWGGRESLGLDCSGLIQQSLLACGQACPRDTDQQEKLGQAVQAPELSRGDLVFWKGHVAMMLDEARMIHANAHHMAVVIEPLAEARARYLAAGVGEPTAFRRPSG